MNQSFVLIENHRVTMNSSVLISKHYYVWTEMRLKILNWYEEEYKSKKTKMDFTTFFWWFQKIDNWSISCFLGTDLLWLPCLLTTGSFTEIPLVSTYVYTSNFLDRLIWRDLTSCTVLRQWSGQSDDGHVCVTAADVSHSSRVGSSAWGWRQTSCRMNSDMGLVAKSAFWSLCLLGQQYDQISS